MEEKIEEKATPSCSSSISEKPITTNPTITTVEDTTPTLIPSTNKPSTPLLNEKNFLGRFYNPPKLERKQSSGDLHSRLKTRKILGVGETTNGDIHRSKISQVLGHNEHLYLKLPRGYWKWHLFLAGFIGIQGVCILLFPKFALDLGLLGASHDENNSHPVATQYYYASTMLVLSFLFWKFLDMNDKAVTRAVQISALIHFASLICLDIFYALGNGLSLLFGKSALIMMGIRIAISLICYSYIKRIGTATSGLRRSPSYKDTDDKMKDN